MQTKAHFLRKIMPRHSSAPCSLVAARKGIFPWHPLCRGESGQGWIGELAVGVERGLGSPRYGRLGSRRYFCVDPDSTAEKLVFNRTLPLKDSWAKIEKRAGTP
ncbi:MAG: hypothetical protein ACRD3N_13675 [Terracidiphilus sp.]